MCQASHKWRHGSMASLPFSPLLSHSLVSCTLWFISIIYKLEYSYVVSPSQQTYISNNVYTPPIHFKIFFKAYTECLNIPWAHYKHPVLIQIYSSHCSLNLSIISFENAFTLPLCPLEGGHSKCILMYVEKRAAQLKPDWKSDLLPNVTRTSWDNDGGAMHQYPAGSLILTLTDALSTETLI